MVLEGDAAVVYPLAAASGSAPFVVRSFPPD
jgi:hypothetical protein